MPIGGSFDNMNNLFIPLYIFLLSKVTALSAANATALGVKITNSEVIIITPLFFYSFIIPLSICCTAFCAARFASSWILL